MKRRTCGKKCWTLSTEGGGIFGLKAMVDQIPFGGGTYRKYGLLRDGKTSLRIIAHGKLGMEGDKVMRGQMGGKYDS